MLVRELIEILQTFDPNVPVIRQDDDEGNGYQQTHGAEEAYGENVNEYQPDIYCTEDILSGEYNNYWDDTPKTLDDFEKVVVIW